MTIFSRGLQYIADLTGIFRKPAAAPPAPDAPFEPPSHTKPLEPYKQEDGSYHFRLQITRGVTDPETGTVYPDKLSTHCELAGLRFIQSSGSLIRAQHLANLVKISLQLNFRLKDAAIYFAQDGCDDVIDGGDQVMGLAEGDNYTLIVVPPEAEPDLKVRPKLAVPAGTCPILQPAFQ